jgi:hypothetical protein
VYRIRISNGIPGAYRPGFLKLTVMQFKIENKVTTTQTVTLDAPAFYKALGVYYYLTDKILMKVSSLSVSSMENGTSIHSAYIEDLVKYGKIITQQEFEIEYEKQIKCLTEQYRLSTAMHIEPKDQVEQETKPGLLPGPLLQRNKIYIKL